MKLGSGAVVAFGIPRAAAFPAVVLSSRSRQTLRCYSSSFSDHVSFIKDVAAAEPPEHLNHLMKILQLRGEQIVSPGAKQGILPLAVPLSKNDPGALTALLRWPTAPPGMEMPVVEVRNYGVWLLAKNVDQYINRILVEEDVLYSQDRNGKFFDNATEKFYQKGDFAASQISSVETYLLKKICSRAKVKQHFDKGDHVSALVTGEFYTKREHFPGFGRPFVFNAKILLKVGRNLEAKDSARVALKSPWWTLGCEYKEVANLALWDDEQIEYIREKVTDEGRKEDIKKGKDPAQVTLDEAAFLLDLASVDGSWDACVERVAECYKESRLHDIANFVLYRDLLLSMECDVSINGHLQVVSRTRVIKRLSWLQHLLKFGDTRLKFESFFTVSKKVMRNRSCLALEYFL